MPLAVRERKLHDHFPVDEREAHAGLCNIIRSQAAALERRLQRLVIRNVCAGAGSTDRLHAGKRHIIGGRQNIQIVDRQADQLLAGKVLHLGADLPDQHRFAGADTHSRGIGLQLRVRLQHLSKYRRVHATVRLGIFHGRSQPITQTRIALAGLDRHEDGVRIRRKIAIRLHIGDDRIRRRLQGLIAQLQIVEHELGVRVARADRQDTAELVDRQLDAGVGIERSNAAGHLRGIQSAAEHGQEEHCRRCGPALPRAAAMSALRHRDDLLLLRLLHRSLHALEDGTPAIRRLGNDLGPQLFQQFLIGQDRHLPSNCAAFQAHDYNEKWLLPAGFPAGQQFLCA